MRIDSAKRIPVKFSGKPVLHLTAGYRLWAGSFEASEPIVALSLLKTGQHVVWARSSHRTGVSLHVEILFSPVSERSSEVQIAFCVADACTYGGTVVPTSSTHPAPDIKDHFTGELIDVGVVRGEPICELKALIMARSDVKSVRNGVWHARPMHTESFDDPWKTMLSYGRTGDYEIA